MPVARAKFHPHIKYALYDISDEVYVIAPLGKILRDPESKDLDYMLNDLNEDLGLSDEEKLGTKKKYKLINSEELCMSNYYFPSSQENILNSNLRNQLDTWINKTTLVTTKRTLQHDILNQHFVGIESVFDKKYSYEDLSVGSKLLAIKYEDIQIPKEYQLIDAIPHENLRPFKNKYFQIH